MRVGDLQGSMDQSRKDSLVKEADFFGLPGLCDLLLGIGYAKALSSEDAQMREAEDALRATFHSLPRALAVNISMGAPRRGSCIPCRRGRRRLAHSTNVSFALLWQGRCFSEL